MLMEEQKLRKTVKYKKINEVKKQFCINVINKGEKPFFYTENLYPFRVNFMSKVLIVVYFLMFVVDFIQQCLV